MRHQSKEGVKRKSNVRSKKRRRLVWRKRSGNMWTWSPKRSVTSDRSPGEHFPVSQMTFDVLLKLTKPLGDQWQVIKVRVLLLISRAVVGKKMMATMKNDRSVKGWVQPADHKRILDQSFILMSSPDWHTAIYLFENYNQQKIKSKINYLLRLIGHSGEWWVQLRGLSLVNSSVRLAREERCSHADAPSFSGVSDKQNKYLCILLDSTTKHNWKRRSFYWSPATMHSFCTHCRRTTTTKGNNEKSKASLTFHL